MKTLLYFVVGISLLSCVPGRQYEELKEQHNKCQEELNTLKNKYQNSSASMEDIKTQLDNYKKENKKISDQKEMLQNTLDIKEKQYTKINDLYQELLELQDKRDKINSSENEKILKELNQTRAELQAKEDNLNKLQNDLNQLKIQLDEKETQLLAREKRVNELEEILKKQEESTQNLKNTIADALLSFKDKGLTVEEKNGKVYVSMEAKLLFASGSISVDSEGKKALTELAKALENEKDLEILVEGHTDSDALKRSAHPKDNWELSVLRATSVVKILLENSKIDPKIISASGRSEYISISEDKAKNRRIEVILSPNLSKLYEAIKQ